MPRGRFFFGPGFWKWGGWPYWAGWRHLYWMGPWAWRPGWWAPWRHFPAWGAGDPSPKEEAEFLKEQADLLRSEIEEIERRLKELEGKDKES